MPKLKPKLPITDEASVKACTDAIQHVGIALSVLRETPTKAVAEVIMPHIERVPDGILIKVESCHADTLVNVLENCLDGGYENAA